MSVLVRRATPADIPAMSRVLIASITELCAADHNNDRDAIAAWTANKSDAGIQAMLADSDLIMLVAALEGQVAAVGAVTRGGEIGLNYASPEARFPGVSTMLMASLEAELAALGFEIARLKSTATARQFYLSREWRPVEAPRRGRFIESVTMEKTLVREPSADARYRASDRT